jgi:hypothetical protein
MMEIASTFEILVNFYQTTRRYNPEDSHLEIKPNSPRYLEAEEGGQINSLHLALYKAFFILEICRIVILIVMHEV